MARDFNSISDTITAAATQLRYPMTVGLWIYMDTTPTDSNVMVSSGDGLNYQGTNTSGAGNTISINTHYYVAAVFTASNLRFIKITTDGVITAGDTAHSFPDLDGWAFYVHTNTQLAVNWEDPEGTENTRLGVYTNAGFPFAGQISHVQIWDAQLTDAEVSAARFDIVRPEKLLRWYELFGVSSPEPDWSAAPSHGTVAGAVRIDHPPGIGFPMMTTHQILASVPAVTEQVNSRCASAGMWI